MKFVGWLLNVLATMVLVMVIWTYGPAVETYVNPVVSPITITRTQALDATHTRIWFSFTKYRKCRPIGVFWYRGLRNGLFEPARFVVEASSAETYNNRPLGEQAAGPWIVDLSIKDVLERSFADSQHSCWPLWPTISDFYNSRPPAAPP